jgi:UDP-GlcNAc3NAcA epimerase
MTIVHIVGNRPQFIKLAILLKELSFQNDNKNIIIHSGQHFDSSMSDIFFDELKIPAPDYFLNVNNLSHNEMLGDILKKIDPVLEKIKPDCVIVYGDTNTTLAGAIAAKKRKIFLVHIEAGVRTFDEEMPEETNRYLADRIADLNFTCTYLGVENLKKEGFFSGNIHSSVFNSGDLMLDAAMLFKDVAFQRSTVMERLDIDSKNFVLATIHRAENTNVIDALRNIIAALNEINQQIPVVFPVHPKTKKIIEENKIQVAIKLHEPLGYLDMLALTQSCKAVITDSGGLSRESFFFYKPTLVIMKKPFWVEIFEHGNCTRSSAITEEIISSFHSLLQTEKIFHIDIFGDGNAAKKISDKILQHI